MRVLHIASEVAPYSQTGGLAQVAAALPKAQRSGLGIDAQVLSPLYRSVAAGNHALRPSGRRVEVSLNGSEFAADIYASTDGGALFVNCPKLYDRDGLYTDSEGREFDDNPVRFAFLARVGAILGGGEAVLHAHDWHAGLVAAYAGPLAKTVFTIHNLAHQGVFEKSNVLALGLDWADFTIDGFEFWDQLSFLKAGAAFSKRITTVSPTYAVEITRPEFGQGLDGFFRANSDRLSGIVNGLDVDAWNPATDPLLAANYTVSDFASGKRACRAELCRLFELEVADDQLLCGVVSRLTHQKGPDLVAELVPKLSAIGAAVVVLGDGEREIEARFRKLAEWFKDHLAVRIGFDNELAHAIFAGCDAILMPSRFEPCGLAQLSAMRYGTLPIAHAVGGLVDTIDKTTGFLFRGADSGGLEWATARAARRFRQAPDKWGHAVTTAMARDFSWKTAAAAYAQLYRAI